MSPGISMDVLFMVTVYDPCLCPTGKLVTSKYQMLEKSNRFFLLIVLATNFLLGCSSSPLNNTFWQNPLPKKWSHNSSKNDPVKTHWLKAFGDSELSVLVNEALDNNYALKAASAQIGVFAAQARIEGADRWPQLDFTPGYQRQDQGDLETGAFAALFQLKWEIDVWGRIAAARDAANRDVLVTISDYRNARLSLAARTAQSYFELLEARLQVEVAEQSMYERNTIVNLVKGRFTRGLVRGLDLRLALTDLARAKEQVAQERNRLQIVKRRLETLLGRYPSAQIQFDSVLPNPPAQLSAGIPAELLSRRPDLISALERIYAAGLRVDSARKALLPRITLTAAGGVSSAALTELIDPRTAIWNLAMGIVQPLFTGDRLMGVVDFNRAQKQQAVNEYRETVLNAFCQVEQALTSEQHLREQEVTLREAVEQTQASRRLAIHSYQHGFIQILTLLDSYRSTLDAQSDHLSVQRKLLNNRIDLYLALGGDV